MGGRAANSNPYSRYKRKPFQYPPDWAEFLDLADQRIVKILGMGKRPELGPDVVLYLRYKMAYNAAMHVDLTRLTEAELDAFKAIVLDTIELARPIVQFRDRVAKDEFDKGNDSDPRIYRQVPHHVTRPWAVGIDAESVLQRLADIPERPEPEQRSGRATGAPRGAVAERDEDTGESQDNSPTPD